MPDYQEINFDGLVGPTHHYGGLSADNFASDANKCAISNPQKAALQGLAKMKALHDKGFPQGILPPLKRPSINTLRALGIKGNTHVDVLKNALTYDPHLLSATSSASSMWTANAATIAPSCDTEDQQLHFVTANLNSKLHRAFEAPETYRLLSRVFGPHAVFPALPGGQAMGDEGAANHTRLSPSHGTSGLHVFVYGRDDQSDPLSNRLFLGRQTLEASKAVARKLNLKPSQSVFIEQSQRVIDAGVFHNDVIAVGNLNCYFSHELAYTNGGHAREQLSAAFHRVTGENLRHIVVPDSEVSLKKAVKSYLFNSQLIGPADNMTLIAPEECREDDEVHLYLEKLCNDRNSAISQVLYFDLRESMRNGGGPACLRLRVVMNQEEINSLGARVMLDLSLYEDLVAWVKKHYRQDLQLKDLADGSLIKGIDQAYRELSDIMNLGEVFSETLA